MKIDRREIRELTVCICRRFMVNRLCPKHGWAKPKETRESASA